MKNYYNGPAYEDYGVAVSNGDVPGVTYLHKFGYNIDVDSGADEDVWDVDGDWPGPLSAAETFNITSTSTDDDGSPVGSGARTTEIFGLDGSYAEASETITLDGQSDVETSGSYVVLYRMIVRTAGSGGANAGNITATPTGTGGTVMAQITIGENQTLMACYMVPAGKKLLVTSYYWAVGEATPAATKVNLTLRAQPDGEPWQTKHRTGGDVGSNPEQPFDPPLPFAAKTVLCMRASTNTDGTEISAGFNGYLKDV